MSRRVSFRAGLVWAMGLLAAAYVAALALHDVGGARPRTAGLTRSLTAGWAS
jgi:hypothetical protein